MYEQEIQDAGFRALADRGQIVRLLIDGQKSLEKAVNGLPNVVKALDEVVEGGLTGDHAVLAKSLRAVARGQIGLARLVSAQSALLAVYGAGPQVAIDASLLAAGPLAFQEAEAAEEAGNIVADPEGGGLGTVTHEVVEVPQDPPAKVEEEVSSENF